MQAELSPRLMSRFSEWVASRMGLYFPRERWGDLERSVGAAAAAFKQNSTASYIEGLLESSAADRGLIETLAGYLTVGETYFFREPQTFEALESIVLPELLQTRRNEGNRRLRFWSAGCCTGEEPYSIAMLLDRVVPDYRQWNATILATDITPKFLQKAVRGEYGDWSFRGTPEWIRSRYFAATGAGRYLLDRGIRERVTFSYLNLADDVYPSLSNDTNAMDVIFCRNVLMYFNEDRARKVVEGLRRSLVEGGWLILGTAEACAVPAFSFTTVEYPGTLLYRKSEDAGSRKFDTADAVAPVFETPAGTQPFTGAFSETAMEADAVADRSVRQVDGRSDFSERARKCANLGKLEEAGVWCERAIAYDKFDPDCRYLFATVLQEQGRCDEAVKSLARAIYLAPDFVLAHFALANLRLRQKRPREADKSFINVLRLLQSLAPDEVLPESDGLTAGRLKEIVAGMRDGLIDRNAAMTGNAHD
ncbi:MAG: CheR family methyltransferase [Gammaproteobacteria bacterium]